MSVILQEHFYQFRFLLHGHSEHYSSSEPLYVTSRINPAWGTVADRILEEWRVISPLLVERIPLHLWDVLNIHEISPQNLIAELSPNSLTSEDLPNADDRKEVLDQISLNPQHKALWKSLALHEASDGRLVTITETTYRENSEFPLPPQLRSHITLIRRTHRPEWIPLWTRESAIEFMLNQINPQQFSRLMLQLISEAPNILSSQELLEQLRATAWLYSTAGNAIAPKQVVLFPSHLQSIEQELEQLFQNENSSCVGRGVLDGQIAQEVLARICPTWYENDVLEFLLTETRQASHQVSLILSLLRLFEQRRQAISNSNVERLRSTPWLVDRRGQPRSPLQIVHLPALETEATKILEQLSNWNYVTASMLQSNCDIRVCLEHTKLRDLFISGERASECMGEAIAQLPEYYLGDIPITRLLLERFIQVFHNSEVVPVLSLAQGISIDEFEVFILSQAAKPIEDAQQLERILNWITATYPIPQSEVVEVYNYYLRLACRSEETFSAEILPCIQLLNQMRQWRSPHELCDGERYMGIDLVSVLDKSQQQILSSYLSQRPTVISSHSIPPTPTGASNAALTTDAQQLEKYFRPWLPYLASEVIGGFLCLLAGTNTDIQQLAQAYLQSRSFDGLRERLLWSENLRSRNFTIKIQPSEVDVQTVENLLDNSFSARIQQNQEPEHLFVGQVNHLTTELTLLEFQIQDPQALSNVLLNSVTILIKRIYRTDTESLNEVWQELANSQRLYVESARAYIFKNLSLILRMLGVQSKTIKNYLRDIEKFKQELAELDLRSDARVRERQAQVTKSLQKAEDGLSHFINTDPGATASILQAVQRKIGQGQYGYSVASIPFELFQNADDSLAELERMLSQNLPERSLYVLTWDANRLTVMHWGRPINLAVHPDVPNQSFEDQGFNRDLSKMLNFNISDKAESETGKFGLGFKTVHLISQEPYVISGDLKFTIQAGLLPFALPRRNRQEADEKRVRSLRDQLRQATSEITDGTLIDLPLNPNITAEQIISEFKQQAVLLLVFAKHIKTCQLVDEFKSRETLTWQPATVLGIEGIEHGTIRFLNDSEQRQEYKLLRFRLASGDVAIVLPSDFSQGASPLTQLPTFWVTAPTKESLGLRFVINGAFDITTGRTSLDRNSSHNRDLIRQIGENLGEKLCELFQITIGNWDSLSSTLALNEIDAYIFWEFLWNVLAVDWLGRSSDNAINQLLQEGLGGDYCGMGILIASHAALPNGLWGQARQLVRRERVTHQLEGLLADRAIFEQVSSWQKIDQDYSIDRLVHHTVWQSVKKLLDIDIALQSLKLINVLEGELGNRQITPNTANQLGQVISSEKLSKWRISHQLEHDEIHLMLVGQVIYFQSEDRQQYIPARQLLIRNSDSPEERRLAAFAPDDRLLHSAYTGEALQFFLVCRESRDTVSPEELVAWSIGATTETQKQAILEYLITGERRGAFASQLRASYIGTWMEDYPGIREALKINEQQTQAERANRGEIGWDQVISHPASEQESIEDEGELLDVTENRAEEPGEMLRNIFNWWQANYQAEIHHYNERLYPFGIGEMQQRLRSRDRAAWLMLLFLGITHRMGRTRHEQHRDFIRFCLQKGWWEEFSSPHPQSSPEQWMEVLNEYMEEQVENIRWYYWIEKFPSIYRIASYLDAYIDSFLSLKKNRSDFNLNSVTMPRSNPVFQGGGVDAPPLPLGIGANFVLRELLRLQILQPLPQSYIPRHCFVPRANVRRLMTRLGCQDLGNPDPRSSCIIYEFLQGEFLRLGLPDEQTFNTCFDIPFELYSEDSSNVDLRNIHVRDDIDWYESISDEEHSQYDSPRSNGSFVTLPDGRVIPREWMS